MNTKFQDLILIKKFETNLPLSFEIWNSIIAKGKGYSSKAFLSNEELEELTRLENFCLINIKSLGSEAKLNRWRKTQDGYSFYTVCHLIKDLNCKSKWIIKINVKTNQTEIYFNKKCEHINI